MPPTLSVYPRTRTRFWLRILSQSQSIIVRYTLTWCMAKSIFLLQRFKNQYIWLQLLKTNSLGIFFTDLGRICPYDGGDLQLHHLDIKQRQQPFTGQTGEALFPALTHIGGRLNVVVEVQRRVNITVWYEKDEEFEFRFLPNNITTCRDWPSANPDDPVQLEFICEGPGTVDVCCRGGCKVQFSFSGPSQMV